MSVSVLRKVSCFDELHSHDANVFRTESQRDDVGEDDERDDDNPTTSDTLNAAPDQQEADAMCHRAQDGADEKAQHRSEQTPGPTKNVTERGRERHGHRTCEEVRGANPESLRRRGVQSLNDGLRDSQLRVITRIKKETPTDKDVTMTVASRLTMNETIARVNMIMSSCLDGFHSNAAFLSASPSCSLSVCFSRPILQRVEGQQVVSFVSVSAPVL